MNILTSRSEGPAPRLYLASASPRRTELLQQIHLPHRVLHVPAPEGEDEPQHPGEAAEAYVCRTAREKAERAERYRQQQDLPPLPLLAADTTVILHGAVLGKPADVAQARSMLRRLSGSEHEVHTAVAVYASGILREAVSATRVRMRALQDAEIDRYIASGEPFGKAGAYGIQGLASTFIAHISGSYSGVMGLPLYETADLLRPAGITLP